MRSHDKRIYRPIYRWEDLPELPPLKAQETYALDFKSQHNSDPSEHAKDMAAFANAYGGALLVGVAEKADNYERCLLALSDATTVAKDYEDSARNLLAPRPHVDPVVVSFPGDDQKAVVAVNVAPFAGQLVGARIAGTEGWRFPIRTASRHTTYIDPEKAMIYADPRTRKAAILLEALPDNAKLLVHVRTLRDDGGTPVVGSDVFEGELAMVDAHANTIEAWVDYERENRALILAPLEDVEAVWRSRQQWAVRFAGYIRDRHHHGQPRSILYIPGGAR